MHNYTEGLPGGFTHVHQADAGNRARARGERVPGRRPDGPSPIGEDYPPEAPFRRYASLRLPGDARCADGGRFRSEGLPGTVSCPGNLRRDPVRTGPPDVHQGADRCAPRRGRPVFADRFSEYPPRRADNRVFGRTRGDLAFAATVVSRGRRIPRLTVQLGRTGR